MNHIRFNIALSLDERRKVEGTAYAGGVLAYGGERIVIDLDALQLSGKQIPLLHNHDRNRHVGFAYLRCENHRLLIHGEMLDNEYAQEIIAAADEGLRWQLSVHVESDRVLRRHAGDVVNGVSLSEDDVLVLMNAVIREVSFTPTGVDAHTEARILSLSLQQEDNMNQEEINKLSIELAAKNQEIAALRAEVADMQKEKRFTALRDLGVGEKHAAALAAVDAETFSKLQQFLQEKQQKEALLSTHYGEHAAKNDHNPLLERIKKQSN